MSENLSDIGLIGLGVMGSSLALNIESNGLQSLCAQSHNSTNR